MDTQYACIMYVEKLVIHNTSSLFERKFTGESKYIPIPEDVKLKHHTPLLSILIFFLSLAETLGVVCQDG